MKPGQRGFCYVRGAGEAGVELYTYGRSSGFCIDPIEKKPLNHFHPGTSVLSFGTAGCNLGCKFCQNWEMSKARTNDRLQDEASPEAIARAAASNGCRSVAFTYNDPVIFYEYALDAADACHELGVETVAVTAGYITPEASPAFFSRMDAVNVDLKAFTEDFYRRLCAGHIEPVKETLAYIAHETDCWLEVTTLLIPGENDSPGELEALTSWFAETLGPDVPLHFSAFHPDFRMGEKPRTPATTLVRARDIARAAGLNHVYMGNVHSDDGDATFCPGCGARVIERDWYELLAYRLDGDACQGCGHKIAGVFDDQPGSFGRKRVPLRIV
jgi:pyruvate formate lyase activating enzyme